MSTYPDIAEFYDRLHGFKDYEGEVSYVRERVLARLPSARTLLDVACGTGNHVPGLRRHFEVEGLDLSPQMLAQARRKFPDLPLHEADMTSFELGRRYDVVCCLFRSIALARTREGLQATLRAMAQHTQPGGLVLVEPFFAPDRFWTGYIRLHELREPGLTVAWMYTAERDGDQGRFRNHYLIGRDGAVSHHTEDHDLGLFTLDDLRAAFEGAGLSFEHDPQGPSGLGFCIGRRAPWDPSSSG